MPEQTPTPEQQQQTPGGIKGMFDALQKTIEGGFSLEKLQTMPVIGNLVLVITRMFEGLQLKGLLPWLQKKSLLQTGVEQAREGSELGSQMAEAVTPLLQQPYVFCGRLGAGIPTMPGRKFNRGIDCIGVWWFLSEKFKWKAKDGRTLVWTDFSKDGFHHGIPTLSSNFEEKQVTASNKAEVQQWMKNSPDGTLVAFTSHVGMIRNGKLFNAKSPRHGVIDEVIPQYSAGTKIRLLQPQHIRTT